MLRIEEIIIEQNTLLCFIHRKVYSTC